MTFALMLFGLNLRPLYNAIAKVESDRGATSANVYQIRSIYVDDLNRIYNVPKFNSRDVLDRDKSEMMMFLYWKHYGYLACKQTKVLPTYETLARIHNGGPDGWRKQCTVSYWLRVKKELEKEGCSK